MTRYVVSANIGLFLGYLNGVYIYYSASVLKLTLCILTISLFFVWKSKLDRNIFIAGVVFSLFCIYGTLIGHFKHLEKASIESNSTKSVLGDYILQEVHTKDTSTVLIFENMVVYTKSTEHFAPGQSVHIDGLGKYNVTLLPKHALDFKSFDLSQYWKGKNKDIIAFYPKVNINEDILSKKTFNYYTYKIRSWFFKNIEQSMPGKEAGVIMAMVWGDERYITQETNYKYQMAGISHILVLSGFNLAIIVSFTSVLLRSMSPVKRSFVTLIAVISFLLIANGGVSLYRAAIMTLFSIYASVFLKQYDGIYVLWLICLMFSLFSLDVALYDVSFHLSFLATLGILAFYAPVKEFINKKYDTDNIFLDLIIVTCSATLAVAPYILYIFGYFRISGLLFSIFAGFVAPLATIVGILVSFLGSVVYVGKVLGYLAYIPIHLLNLIVETFVVEVTGKPVVMSLLTLFLLYACVYFLYKFLLFINRTYVKAPKSK